MDNIIDQLKRDEGYSRLPYRDSRGVLTIGYGFNIETVGLNQEEATRVLWLKAGALQTLLGEALPWVRTLGMARYMVLVNMAYNLGVAGVLEFTKMLGCIKLKDWEGAACEMGKSEWAKQVGPRATRLAEQMRSGEWQ